MQKLTINEIAEATGGRIVSGDGCMEIDYITTDSRKSDGGLFVPIAGERLDGHDFIASAFDTGAVAVITHRDVSFPQKAVIRVKDTLEAFGDIARLYKAKYKIPTVAVTGSVGKTTTKDMIAGVLGERYSVLKTQGNFNNEIGVPITVLSIEKEHDMAVIELGMSHFGEIEKLTGIVKPDAAVITNIGMSHIENLGSREGIFRAKMEIVSGLPEGGALIVNGDDEYLKTVSDIKDGRYRLISYGIHNPACDVRAENIRSRGIGGTDFTAVTPAGNIEIKVNVAGEHNVYNALAAVCAGMETGVGAEDIARGIENFSLTAMRMSVEDMGGATVINDCYNASPDSVRAALKVLASAPAKRRIAVLGDILEMGDYAPNAHTELGQSVYESGADILVTAGENAARISKRAGELGLKETHAFDGADAAADFCRGLVKEGDAVLIKASRAMGFEKIYNAVKESR